MTNKYSLIILLLLLTLFTAKGQNCTKVDLGNYPNGYIINKSKLKGSIDTFIFTGTYNDYDILNNTIISGHYSVIGIDESVDKDITIVLDNVTIIINTATGFCSPIVAIDFNYRLTLCLRGENNLKASVNGPAILVPSNSKGNLPGGGSLVIKDSGDGDGILNATGGKNAAAIGSRYYAEDSYHGNIIIQSGTINARGGNLSAAIGSSFYTGGGTVTIEGGYVTATGDKEDESVIGIGNGGLTSTEYSVSGGTVNITGGVVKVQGTNGYPGIGTGLSCKGGTVEINGGTVTAMGRKGSKGIDGEGLTFNATGNAFIITDGIGHQGNKPDWQGVIFENNEGTVYPAGTQPLEITRDATIPDAATLTVTEGTTLTIPQNVTLRNDGTIHNDGTIIGTITGNPLQHGIMFYSNYTGASPEYTTTYVTENTQATVSSETRTREKYTFEGWFDQPSGGTEVTELTVTAPTKLYAHWKKNEIRTIASVPSLKGTYGGLLDYGLNQLIADDSYKNGLTYEFADADPNAEHYGMEIQSDNSGWRLAGTPDKVTTAAATIGIKISSKDCEEAVLKDIPVSIDQRELIVTPLPDQIIYKGEGPTFTSRNNLANEEPAFSGQLGVDPGTGMGTGIITLGTITPQDNGAFLAANYKLTLQTGVACAYTDRPASEIGSQPTGTKSGDWYAGPVIFTAPAGFTIKLKEATPATTTTTTKAVEAPVAMGINTKALSAELRASGEGFAASFTFGQEGKYDVSYLLRRDAPYNQEYGHTEPSVFIDLTAPVASVTTSYQSYTLTATDGTGSGIASVLIDNTPVQLTASGRYDGYGSEGPHSYKVTDNVGHTTEGSFSLYARETYTVVIPETEGTTLTPAPGTYYYDEGDFFLLRIELDPAYSQSVPVVKANDRVIDPNRDGSYTISVYNDIVLSIGGIPVSIDRISDSKSHVYASAGVLHIETATPRKVLISTMEGKVIRYWSLPAGSNRVYGLPEGFYIVRLSDGTTQKVGITGR